MKEESNEFLYIFRGGADPKQMSPSRYNPTWAWFGWINDLQEQRPKTHALLALTLFNTARLSARSGCRRNRSPVIALNRAVAISQVHGPAAALAAIEAVPEKTLAGKILSFSCGRGAGSFRAERS